MSVNVTNGYSMKSLKNGDALPEILSDIDGGGEVNEGEPAHLEFKFQPFGDAQIQWFKDNSPLNASSRINTVCERGLIALDIFYTTPEDTGTYYCTITNAYGSIQSEPTYINVIVELDSYDQDQYQSYTDPFQLTNGSMKDENDLDKPHNLPQFEKQPTISQQQVVEGEPVYIEAYLNKTKDSSLQIEWLRNDQPISTGSRFNAILDRGLVALEIRYCLSEDSGEYVCVAKNALGQVRSHPVTLSCEAEDSIVTKSILDEASISHLKQLDDPIEGPDYSFSSEKFQPIPPSFKQNLEPAIVELNEDESVIFTVPVECGNGNRLSVEWKKNGEVVKTGSRITGSLELGLASLKIHYAQASDAGVYTCHVTTEHGSVESTKSQLDCSSSCTIIAASQLPGDREKGLQAIEAIEANLHAPRETNYDDDDQAEQPEILQEPEDVGEVEEGTAIHFDVQVNPATDPSLYVEWYKNGDLLSSGTRFKVNYDRGFATLDLVYTISEDSGEYWCKITNKTGSAESRHIQVLCHASESVITHSNLLEGSDGYNLIKAIEDVDASKEEFRYSEAEEADSKPEFLVKLQTAIVAVGEPVKFLVRICGKPTPIVKWYLNDELIEEDSMTKIYRDGAINYLEIGRCPELHGENKLVVIAENVLGQAREESVITVVLAEDFRPDLKHVKPENPYKKMLGLRKVDCSPELNKALNRTKPSAQTIMEIERGTEIKARSYRSPEVVEAEKMLSTLTNSLRKSEIKRSAVNGTCINENEN